MRIPGFAARLILAAAVLACAASSAQPQTPAQTPAMRIAIGAFRSEKQCTLYAVTSGSMSASAHDSAAGYIGPFGAAGARESSASFAKKWRTELVRDCVNNFSALRQSIEAAVAASGHAVVVPAGTRGAYTITGQISEAGVAATSIQGGGVDNRSADAVLNVQFSLRDARGRVVHGALITKRLNIASSSTTGLVDASSAQAGRSVYTQLQREAALAVARSAAFKLDPLRVTSVAERRVRLNYGSPFLALGATVYLQGGGGEQIKGEVVSAFPDSAWVETRGTGDISRVAPGSLASFVEADDPAANGRVYESVDLPF